MFSKIFMFVVLITAAWGGGLVFCMEPQEVLVVANRRMAESEDLALYYIRQRGIPESHLLSLSLTLKETMSRQEYDTVLKKQVFETLNNLRPKTNIAAIVLIYGVPLKVAPSLPTWEEQKSIDEYKKKRDVLAQDTTKSETEVKKNNKYLSGEVRKLLKTNMRAAVDSELALVKAGDYNLDGWLLNPFFLGFANQTLPLKKDQVLLVCRLDGPDPATVYRIIDDTLLVEQQGLHGKAYFDAQWPDPGIKELTGYKLYDQSLHRAAEHVKKRMEVILDNEKELFAENCCPQAALYCGWYSLGNYIDSFAWQKGAIGYHIASAECSSLKENKRRLWCMQMLEKGVAATIGPVYEPYVQGFPLPEMFFSLLVEGYMSLGESYLVSLPFLSWQMVLIGDPLYQPFVPIEQGQQKKIN